jgi:hypothetical protein
LPPGHRSAQQPGERQLLVVVEAVLIVEEITL